MSSSMISLRRSARLAKMPRKNYTETTDSDSEPVQLTTATQPWTANTETIQDIQTLSTFPTYRELFRKYNLPISFINHERNHLTLESGLSRTMQGTDYAAAIKAYCYFMSARNGMDTTLMHAMVNAMGMKDCAIYAKTDDVPDKPTYDTKTHRIWFEPTLFDPKGVALFAKAPDYNPHEVKDARKTSVAPLRKSSFMSGMRVFLEKMDLIDANRDKYPSDKDYMDAKVQCVQNLYIQILLMQDILVGEDSLRRFTLTTETKAFALIQEICNHREITPVLASETLFVLRSHIVMVRALMTALED